MKLHITLNDGTLIDTVEDIEQYREDSRFAASSLLDSISAAVFMARKVHKDAPEFKVDAQLDGQ